MGWQTREHWRNGGHQLWLQELWDVYSAGWRVEWSGAKRIGQAFTNGRYEQPPDPARHAVREIQARRLLAEKQTEVAGGWEQVG